MPRQLYSEQCIVYSVDRSWGKAPSYETLQHSNRRVYEEADHICLPKNLSELCQMLPLKHLTNVPCKTVNTYLQGGGRVTVRGCNGLDNSSLTQQLSDLAGQEEMFKCVVPCVRHAGQVLPCLIAHKTSYIAHTYGLFTSWSRISNDVINHQF